MLNLEALLAPISEARPGGEDMAFSRELDAIARARESDDPSLEQGAWVTALKEADWPYVARTCAELLTTRTKDLRLAVWLAEAQVRTGRFDGLAHSMAVIAGLCVQHWEHVHPLPDEAGFEQRIGNLCWLAAQLPNWVQGLSAEEREHARACAQALEQLERAVDERLGADGPSFSRVRNALEPLCAPQPSELAANADADNPDPASAIESAGQTSPGGVEAASLLAQGNCGISGCTQACMGSKAVRSRAEALASLRTVAEYFRRTEPHSPVAYLADKAADWGEQSLHDWLRTVIKDQATLAQLEDTLGVQ